MNDSELRTYEKYENLGYDVIQYGVPDLILLKNGKIEFVEVKKDSSYGLNEYQKRAFKLLEKHGIEVRVEMVIHFKEKTVFNHYTYPLNLNSKFTAPRFPSWLFARKHNKRWSSRV